MNATETRTWRWFGRYANLSIEFGLVRALFGAQLESVRVGWSWALDRPNTQLHARNWRFSVSLGWVTVELGWRTTRRVQVPAPPRSSRDLWFL